MLSPRMVPRFMSMLLAGAALLCLAGCDGSPRDKPGEKAQGPTGASSRRDAALSDARPTQTLPFQVRLGTPEENAITVCEFVAGSGFTPAERAVVQAEDAEDRRRDPQQMFKADRQVAAILQRIQRSTPLQETITRELMMNAIFGKTVRRWRTYGRWRLSRVTTGCWR